MVPRGTHSDSRRSARCHGPRFAAATAAGRRTRAAWRRTGAGGSRDDLGAGCMMMLGDMAIIGVGGNEPPNELAKALRVIADTLHPLINCVYPGHSKSA